MKTRPISQATQASKQKAQRSVQFLKPYKARPETTSFVASKLIGASLGISNLLTSEKANEEKKKLKDARGIKCFFNLSFYSKFKILICFVKDKKRKEKELNEAIWNGNV